MPYLITPEAMHKLGTETVAKTEDAKMDHRTFVAFFGTSPEVLSECWDRIHDKEKSMRPKHLIWGAMFMKLYLPEDAMVFLLGTTKPTFRKWVWLVMENLALTSHSVIDINKRNRNFPKHAWCRMSVDGTDFKVHEPYPFNKKWMSHKFQGSALKYEVGISIYSGDIVWVYGPHRGAKHDLTIFREALKDLLDGDEMVEADQGYKGECDFIRVKEDYISKEEQREKGRVRYRHETCNRRFKCWSILKQDYRHDIKKHGLVFRAIAVMTQMAINNGDCLFGCEPVTKKKKQYTFKDLMASFEDLNVE